MKNGTEAKYIGLEKPMCDICTYEDQRPNVPALYDGRIKGGSAWGYMCQRHFKSRGVGLGTGKGQKLIFENETPVA